jgi:ubiquinone/menaquinone biosynthesis C-methylase UbiE
MPDAREVYELHPEKYDALVRCEDRDGNLLTAIRSLAPLEGSDVVEFGAGTGRVTVLLAPHVRTVRAFDIAAPMVEVARRHLGRLGTQNWEIGVADNANVPVPDDTADLAVAGWTYGHQTVWNEDDWKEPIQRAIREMLRVLRPGGTAIVIETLGTGHTEPFDPPTQLAGYYALLADEFLFTRRWIRTDYEFSSMADGVRLVRLFFGEERANLFEVAKSHVLPECTGLWWRRK